MHVYNYITKAFYFLLSTMERLAKRALTVHLNPQDRPNTAKMMSPSTERRLKYLKEFLSLSPPTRSKQRSGSTESRSAWTWSTSRRSPNNARCVHADGRGGSLVGLHKEWPRRWIHDMGRGFQEALSQQVLPAIRHNEQVRGSSRCSTNAATT